MKYWVSACFLGFATFVMSISATAAEPYLATYGDDVFGPALVQNCEHRLQAIDTQLLKQKANTVRAAKIANLYLAVASSTQSDSDIKTLMTLRPQFNEAVAVLMAAASTADETLFKSGFAECISNIQPKLSLMLKDDRATSEYLSVENRILSQYGVTASGPSIGPALEAKTVLQKQAATTKESAKKLAAIPTKEIPKYVEGVENLISGAIKTVADLTVVIETRRASVPTVISISDGITQFEEGWEKLFG